MDAENVKIRAETVYLRSRAWLRTFLGLFGLGLVVLGAVNMLLGAELFVWYRDLFPMLTVADGANRPIIHVADVAVVAIGAVIAWFV
jgi:hypothetical protein